MTNTTNTAAAKHYAKRDPEAQGTHYENHVYAMTTEGLHAKSAIAAELAHRDIEIERLRVAFAAPAQAVAPTDIITASIMHDDGGEHPAFCLMVAYRAEKDAKAALAILADAPARHPGDMRKYVEAFAAKSGWNPGSGEGAFEYAQRVCYSQGFEDATVQSQRKTHAAPAGMEPVARIERIDEYGPRLEWTQHWVDVGVGAKLFTESQVQATLDVRNSDNKAAPSGPAREPLSQERLQFLSGEYEDIPEEGVAFRDGWRSAEMHHGITAAQKGGQHG